MLEVGTVVRLRDEVWMKYRDTYEMYGIGRGSLGVVTSACYIHSHNEVEVSFFMDINPREWWALKVDSVEEVTDAHDQGE